MFWFQYFIIDNMLIKKLQMEDKRTTSFAANPFWTTKPILLKKTFMGIWDIMLLSMPLETLFSWSTTSDDRKQKNVKCKWYKSMLILRTHFLMFDYFTWRNFRDCLSHHKSLDIQSHKWGNLSQVHTCMCSSYPTVYQNIRWPKCRSSILWIRQEVHMRLLQRYSRPPKNIKKDMPKNFMNVFEAGKLLTIKCMFSKDKTHLTTNNAYIINST